MSHGKITDTSIFACPETTDESFTLDWDSIGELITGYNKENANVPQNPEATNLTIAEIVKKEYAMRYVFSKAVANAHRYGDIRVHDMGMIDRVYCGGQSPAYIAKFGLNLPDAMTIAKPAKHAIVLIEQIIKMSASLQGVFAGAIGWDAVNMYVAPYIRGLSDAEVKQLAQVLIYEFSQQAVARGGQSIFSDINLYWEIPKHFRNTEAILPGGVTDGSTYADYVVESKRFFKALMAVYNEGDAIGRPFFFPKPDVHITEAFFEEPDHDEALEILCGVASKMGSPYFIFDRGETVKISECCFDGDTEVLVRDSTGVMKLPISEIKMVNNLKVFHNGTWAKAKKIVVPRGDKVMYRIRTVNGKELVVTEDHIFPTITMDKEVKCLTPDDYLMFSTRASHGDHGTFAMGVLVGAYLGDGSTGTNTTIFSMNPTKVELLKPYITQGMADMGVEANVFVDKKGTLESIRIHSKHLMERLSDYVICGTASMKGVQRGVFDMSEQFRRGLVFGLYATDGGNSRRIYTTSKRLADDMETIFTTLGIQCKIDITDRRAEGCIIRGQRFNRNHVLYTIKWYDPKQHRRKEGVYKQINNSMYFKIESIEELKDYDKSTVYCFQMEYEDEPYFTLPCGVITHNCRLAFELSEEDLKECCTPWKIRTAALQNVTINLPRLAYRSDNMVDFYENLSTMVDLCASAHIEKYKYIEGILKQNNSPLGLLNMNLDGEPYLKIDKMAYLIGMLGLNEAVEAMIGKDLSTPEGYELGFDIVWELGEMVKMARETYGMKFVLEQTPAESTTYSLAKLDIKHFGEMANRHTRGTMDAPYYTNSTQLPIDADISAIERIKKEGTLHPMIEAGAITHIWLGEHAPDPKGMANLVKKIFHHSSNVQVAFSPEFTTCVACGKTTRGLLLECPKCGSADVEGITRVTGYFSKVKKWNSGKVSELKDRHRQNI